MEFLNNDKGDTPENNLEAMEGIVENDEPKPEIVDTWARNRIPSLIPDKEFIMERETEEKRKLRAKEFIDDKHPKVGVFRQSLKRLTTAASTARYTNVYSSIDDLRPQTVPQDLPKSGKTFRIEPYPSDITLEMKKMDEELRSRKAFEIKETKEYAKRMREEKEKEEIEEKKKQKYEHELKGKLYTYNVKGKITFLDKDHQKLPKPLLPRSQWEEDEGDEANPHYSNFRFFDNATGVVNSYEKNYKEYRTGDIPENVTIVIANSTKVIKVIYNII